MVSLWAQWSGIALFMATHSGAGWPKATTLKLENKKIFWWLKKCSYLCSPICGVKYVPLFVETIN
jgi:hypothetical protein